MTGGGEPGTELAGIPRLRPGQRIRSWLCALSSHLPAALLLSGTAVFLFRLPLFEGYRFIGNSDRWNHHLSFATFHSSNLTRGTFSAWSEFVFTGFDTLSSPGSFFSPLFVLPTLLGTGDVVKVFGYVAVTTLVLTLLVTYAVLQSLCRDRLAAVTGSLIFALSTFSLLKLSQNDNEYLPVLLTPILFHLVRTATPANTGRRIALTTALVALCVYISLLQPFVYVAIFLLLYGGYRVFRGERAPLFAFTVSLGLAAILGAPRLYVQYADVMQSTRTASPSSGEPLEYVGPELLLRYLDGDIFGRSWREAAGAHSLNLSEGNLLFASVFASMLLVLIVARGRYRASIAGDDPDRSQVVRYGFFVGVIAVVFVVVHWTPAYGLFALLFANVSFLHTRFSVAALFPIALVSSLYLTRDRAWRPTLRRGLVVALTGIAILALGTANTDPFEHPVFLRVPGSPIAAMLLSEVLRLVMLGAVFMVLAIARRPLGWLDAGTFRTLLAVVIVGQTILAADHFLSGPQTRRYDMPFETNDSVMAAADEFLPPSPAELEHLHALLDNDRFRSIVLCPHQVIATHCSTAIGMQWRIRLADGYLHGVSRRYMSLPWPRETLSRGRRSIRFARLDEGEGAPWKLLSLLNVRNVIVLTRALYTNKGLDPPSGVVVLRNPSPYVYPRVYFASRAVSVTTAQAVTAIQKGFAPCGPGSTPGCTPVLEKKDPLDYVEGPVPSAIGSEGRLGHRFDGDRIVIDASPSTHARFLVINEAYNPRWHAYADGRELPIYPTNIIMRGLVMPPGTTRVTLRYRSMVDDSWKYLAALLPAAGLTVLGLRRPLRILTARVLGLGHAVNG